MHGPLPRRVAHVLGSSSGGIRRHVRYLAEHPPDGYETAVVAGPPGAGGFFAEIPFVSFDGAASLDPYRPEIVHAHGLTAGMRTLKALGPSAKRPAVVVTVHTSMQQTLRSSLPGSGLPVVQRAMWAAAKLAIHRADAVIAVSPEVAGQVGATDTVAPAVEFAPGPVESPEEVRRLLGTPQDAVVVLAVGRLHPDKSLDLLIEALAGMPVEGWIAGEGPDRLRLEELASGTNVRLLGHRDDVPSLLGAADIFALPSAAESYGFAAMEAVAAGLPVVSTRTGSIPQIVGDAGLLVPPGDRAAFVGAVRRLIETPDLRRAMARRARARRLPQPDELVSKVGDIYDRVIEDRRRKGPRHA